MNLQRVCTCLGVIFLLSLPAVQAEEYQLELLIFSQSSVNTELFKQSVSSINIPNNAIELANPTGADQETLVEMPLISLSKAADNLRNNQNYTLLLQKAWKQKFTPGETTPAIRLQDAAGSLTGYLSCSEEGGVLKAKLDLEYLGHSSNNNNFSSLVYRLTERRKLKSEEPQYFDHPKFGAIVVAKSLAPPPPPPSENPTPAVDPSTGAVVPASPPPAAAPATTTP